MIFNKRWQHYLCICLMYFYRWTKFQCCSYKFRQNVPEMLVLDYDSMFSQLKKKCVDGST